MPIKRLNLDEEKAISDRIKAAALDLDVHDIDCSITEPWLYAVGFRWSQRDRQPSRHWTLWLGRAFEPPAGDVEDIGLEVAATYNDEDKWFCWFRSDFSGLYSRFLHVHHLRTRRELCMMVEGLIGGPWVYENAFYGQLFTHDGAERRRAEDQRLDRQLMLQSHTHHAVEEDDTRAGARADTLQQQAEYRTGATDL